MSFLFTSNPLASSAAPLIQRAPTHRRVVSSDLTPAQIQELLRDSGQFPHVGRFASEYSMDPTLLGKGTFGVVRRCRCLHSAEVSGAAYFAAKEIKYTSLKPDEVTDIINEVRCLGLLNHHHIVHLKVTCSIGHPDTLDVGVFLLRRGSVSMSPKQLFP